MEKFACEFIKASDLFEGISSLHFDLAMSGRITWGDSHRTLVTAQRVLDELYDIYEMYDGGSNNIKEYEILKNRIGNDLDVFVDLEN